MSFSTLVEKWKDRTIFAIIIVTACSRLWGFITRAGNTLHLIIIVITCSSRHQNIRIWYHLIPNPDFLVLQISLRRFMLFLINRSKCVLRSALCNDFQVKRAGRCCAHADANAREDALMNIGNLDKGRLLGYKEDVFLKHEQVALNGFQIGLDARMSFATAITGISKVFQKMSTANLPPLETANSDYFLFWESAENTRDDLKSGTLVVLF
jgi:hypothetical protein